MCIQLGFGDLVKGYCLKLVKQPYQTATPCFPPPPLEAEQVEASYLTRQQ